MKPRRSFQNKVAIKKIKLDQLGSKLHIIAQEILTLKRVDHPSIVNLLEIYREENTLYLVMEYIQGKELFEYIVEQESLKESDAAFIIKQLIKCIYYLNTKKIAHRDLKLENIMIDPFNKKIKLIDFGFSWYYSEEQKMTEKVGTPYYTAPEILKGDGYGPECDMWSIGVIAYILLTGSPPFYDKRPVDIWRKIVKESVRYESEWENLSVASQKFVRSILIKDPSKRIKPEDALKMDWIQQKMENDFKISSKVIKNLVQIREVDEMKKEFLLILFNQMNASK